MKGDDNTYKPVKVLLLPLKSRSDDLFSFIAFAVKASLPPPSRFLSSFASVRSSGMHHQHHAGLIIKHPDDRKQVREHQVS